MNQPGETVCASCGERFAPADVVAYGNSWICAGCKPGFFQRLQQGETPYTQLKFGGFWVRFAAKFIDGILFYLMQMPVAMVFRIPMTGETPKDPAELTSYLVRLGISTFINIGIGVAFTVFFLGRYGATPGKMAFNLKVVRPSGEPIGYVHALARYFAEIVSSLTCFIGYIIVGLDVEKRALHDRIASTRVIKVRR